MLGLLRQYTKSFVTRAADPSVFVGSIREFFQLKSLEGIKSVTIADPSLKNDKGILGPDYVSADHREVHAFMDLLTSNPQITNLSLSGCQDIVTASRARTRGGDRHLQPVLDGLQKNHHISRLEMNISSLGDVGKKTLVDGLADNSGLKIFVGKEEDNFGGKYLSEDVIASLAELVKQDKPLHIISFRENWIRAEHISVLDKAYQQSAKTFPPQIVIGRFTFNQAHSEARENGRPEPRLNGDLFM